MLTLDVSQGATARIQMVFVDPDGEPMDFLGSTLVMRAGYMRDQPLWTKSTADFSSGLTIVDAAAGKVGLKLAEDETDAMPFGTLTTWVLERRIADLQETVETGVFNVTNGLID